MSLNTKNTTVLTPKETVARLDKYIIGQDDAKKKVAIAMRNRYRRAKLSEEMQDEVTPKNILMKGPTGCGKTEIARRLAKLIDAPFIKVEATKFTEVGYVGRDVESMIRDLVTKSVMDVRMQKINKVNEKANKIINEILINAIVEKYKKNNKLSSGNEDTSKEAGSETNNQPANQANILSDLANLVQSIGHCIHASIRDHPQQARERHLLERDLAIVAFGDLLPDVHLEALHDRDRKSVV